jgi:ribosomal protein S1
MTPTDEVNKRFPRGTKVSGVVRYISPFGYFIEIPGIEILGLVETVGPNESQGKNIPEIGSEIEAIIIQFRDSKRPLSRQFRLSVHPNDFANSELMLLKSLEQ